MVKILELTNLTKHYGKNRGISNVNLSIEQGEIFGFLGPNGAGKSTTIRCTLGFIKPNEGCIKIFGNEISSAKTLEEALKNIGYIPSEAWFYPSMKVSEVIKMSADLRKIDCSAEAEMLYDRLQVDKNKKINELSLGNRKKVSIICAMQHKPKLFIFDEPTSGLDPLMQSEFFNLIKGYVNQGSTCLISTHVLSEVKNHCNRAAIMKEGKLLKIDSVENLTKTNVKKIRMVRDGKFEEIIYKDDLNSIYKELQGHHISDITIEDLSLNEIFMHYYN